MNQQSEDISLDQLIPSQGNSSGFKKPSKYVPGERIGKWTQQQHMKYIAFIDYNKERMRSKEKRRSNKFYEQMSNFISSRNALQCRSHHQKLQEKYNHVNKIINAFKNMFDRGSYKETLQNLEFIKQLKPTTQTIKQQITDTHKSVQTQTDIAGMNLQFITMNPNLVIIQRSGQHFPQTESSSLSSNSMYMLPHNQIPSVPSFGGGLNWWPGSGYSQGGFGGMG